MSEEIRDNEQHKQFILQLYKEGLLSSETLARELSPQYIDEKHSEEIIKSFASQMAVFGDDKVLHYIANVMMAELSGGESDDMIANLFEAFIVALEVSLLKEVTDKGISKEDLKVVDMINKVRTIGDDFLNVVSTMNSLELDRGDMYADLCGVFVGCALMVVKNMAFEFDKFPP